MAISIQPPSSALATTPRHPLAPQQAAQPAAVDRDLELLLPARPARSWAPKSLAALVTPSPLLKASVKRITRAVKPMLPTLLAAGTVACLVGAVRGYPCTGHGKSDQYFANGNGSLHGVVHGWFANCEDYEYPCGQSCSSTGLGSTSCTTIYCVDTEVTRSVQDVVSGVAALVQKCGLSLASGIPAGDLLRIANPLIERNKWVKIAVNAFNLTDVTDPAVNCLHAIQ